MVAMIVRHRVANYDKWRELFDSMHSVRAAHNWIAAEVFRDAADPNLVTIVNHVRDAESAKRYGGSPDLHAAMERGGVLGAPDIQFLNEAY
jgi:quinol monooxygenase YgiN